MAKQAAEAEAAGECLRYVGVVDVKNGRGSVELRRYPKASGKMDGHAMARLYNSLLHGGAAGPEAHHVGGVSTPPPTRSHGPHLHCKQPPTPTPTSQDHPFAQLSGSDNIIAFTTQRYSQQPLIVRGPGAGAEVTAGGVFSDLLRLAAYLGAPS